MDVDDRHDIHIGVAFRFDRAGPIERQRMFVKFSHLGVGDFAVAVQPHLVFDAPHHDRGVVAPRLEKPFNVDGAVFPEDRIVRADAVGQADGGFADHQNAAFVREVVPVPVPGLEVEPDNVRPARLDLVVKRRRVHSALAEVGAGPHQPDRQPVEYEPFTLDPELAVAEPLRDAVQQSSFRVVQPDFGPIKCGRRIAELRRAEGARPPEFQAGGGKVFVGDAPAFARFQPDRLTRQNDAFAVFQRNFTADGAIEGAGTGVDQLEFHPDRTPPHIGFDETVVDPHFGNDFQGDMSENPPVAHLVSLRRNRNTPLPLGNIHRQRDVGTQFRRKGGVFPDLLHFERLYVLRHDKQVIDAGFHIRGHIRVKRDISAEVRQHRMSI